MAAFFIIFRAVFRHLAVSAAGASCLQGRFAPLLVMESGLPDGARGIRVRTAWFDSTTPEVPGGRVPLRTVRTVQLGGRSAQRGASPLLRLRRATSDLRSRNPPLRQYQSLRGFTCPAPLSTATPGALPTEMGCIRGRNTDGAPPSRAEKKCAVRRPSGKGRPAEPEKTRKFSFFPNFWSSLSIVKHR